ncbi:MAG: QueT transporter family protein [Candidatus Bathyarchaeota archaeon]|nr:QueT transporter family protein [Candidatus Bathyarchaeota archaeon]
MKFDSRDLALTAIFAALYAVVVIIQGISAAASIQLRIADCLIPLSALFGWPTIIGVSVGCVVGNTYFSATMPNGVYDIIFGPLANLIAATLIFKLRKRRLPGCILGSIIIGLIVGSYIWTIFMPPQDIFGFSFPENMPVWVVTVTSITVSSLIAIAVIGYTLLRILSRPSSIEPLKSKGLKVVTEGE